MLTASCHLIWQVGRRGRGGGLEVCGRGGGGGGGQSEVILESYIKWPWVKNNWYFASAKWLLNRGSLLIKRTYNYPTQATSVQQPLSMVEAGHLCWTATYSIMVPVIDRLHHQPLHYKQVPPPPSHLAWSKGDCYRQVPCIDLEEIQVGSTDWLPIKSLTHM